MGDRSVAWIAFAVSSLIFAVYESWVWWTGRTRPGRMARYAHAQMRIDGRSR
jgi:hypothetical protein